MIVARKIENTQLICPVLEWQSGLSLRQMPPLRSKLDRAVNLQHPPFWITRVEENYSLAVTSERLARAISGPCENEGCC